MPKVEVTIKLSPDEVRKALPEKLQDFFDFMVMHLTYGTGLSEEEAKVIVAQELLKYLKEASEKDV